MKEFKLKSYDGFELYVTLWDDVKDAKGVIQIMHGRGEYAGHYDELARFFNKHGYIAFADDHRAHGRTETNKNRGRHKGNIFKKTLNDELYIRDWLKAQYDLPVFLLGHSYGSFLGQAFAQAGTDVKAIALLGTGHMRATFATSLFFAVPYRLVAWNWRHKFISYVSDRMYHYKGDSGHMQWLNSVKERRDAFEADKYTHVPMSVAFDFSMACETAKLYRRKSLAKLDPTTAIGIFSGDQDPIGKFGRGAKKLHKMYSDLGINCDLHLYEGVRHEVAFGHCAEQVQQDIVDFFDRFIVYRQTSIDDLM